MSETAEKYNHLSPAVQEKQYQKLVVTKDCRLCQKLLEHVTLSLFLSLSLSLSLSPIVYIEYRYFVM